MTKKQSQNQIELLLSQVSPKNVKALGSWVLEYNASFDTLAKTKNISFDLYADRLTHKELDPVDPSYGDILEYDEMLNTIKEHAEKYIQNKNIQHNYIDYQLLLNTIFLIGASLRDKLGYRIEFPVAGYRMNWAQALCKLGPGNPLTIILGSIFSGYIIYPLLMWLFPTPWILWPCGILLGLKILGTIINIITGTFRLIKGKKRPILECMILLGGVYNYLQQNSVLEPKKISAYIDQLNKLPGDIIPPYINIIIDRISKNSKDMFITNKDLFEKVYMRIQPNAGANDAIMYTKPLSALKPESEDK